MLIADRTFVVTGGGNGVGRQVVLGLLARGARVAAVDVDVDGLATTRGLTDHADRLSTHRVDLSDRAAVAALPEEVTATHGSVDGVLNIAGIIHRFARVEDLSLEEIDRVLGVNFWGVVHLTKAFLPLLRERPQACVLNVSSMGALAPVPGQTAYGASKAAVTLFTEGLYAELIGTPVTVSLVVPGGIATDITQNSGVVVPGRDASSPGTGGSLTSASSAAHQIIDAVQNGTFRVIIGRDARTIDRLKRLAPRRAIDLIARRMQRLLAAPTP